MILVILQEIVHKTIHLRGLILRLPPLVTHVNLIIILTAPHHLVISADLAITERLTIANQTLPFMTEMVIVTTV